MKNLLTKPKHPISNSMYKKFIQLSYLIGLIICTTAITHAQQSMRTFHIGNSLADQAYGMHDIARGKGHTSTYKKYTTPGAPLGWLWDKRLEANETEYPPLENESWDNLVLEPYDRGIETDVRYGGYFMDVAYQRNPNCKTFIFAHWPRNENNNDFDRVWDGIDDDGSYTQCRYRGFFEDIVDAYRAAYPNKEIYLVPVPEVMYQINQLAKAGQVPRISHIFDVYRDEGHLNHLGMYIEAVTHFAVIYKQDPQNAVINDLYFWRERYSVPADYAQVVWDVTWDVVRNYANYTGVGDPVDPVSVTGVTLTPSTVSVKRNESERLTAAVAPSNATNKRVTWSSSNTSVATVSGGIVTGVAAGTATITVTTADGGRTATASVTVSNDTPDPISVTGVALTPSTLSVNQNQSATLTATVSPSNATNKNVNWSSSNTSVATVSGGVVTGIALGTATITATTVDGGHTATALITVKEAPSGGSYSYLKFTATTTDGLKITDIEWFSGTKAYPEQDMTSNNSGGVIASGTKNEIAWFAFDAEKDKGMWVGEQNPYQITLNFGDKTISPTGISIRKVQWGNLRAFTCHGSNDGINWTLLHEESGLTDANFPGQIGTFQFNGSFSNNVTDTETTSENLTFGVYPSLVKDNTLHAIVNNLTANDFTQMTIVSMSGNVVFTRDIYGKNEIISTKNLKQGMYIVQLKNRFKTKTNRIIIK
jgi:uncharacterized protein YjdB